jgi:hypothetical protein
VDECRYALPATVSENKPYGKSVISICHTGDIEIMNDKDALNA